MNTTDLRVQVVKAASDWLGTPYVHQASAKGHGTDCLGLVRGVWRDVYGHEPATVPAYTLDWGEAQRDEVLLDAACTHLLRVEASAPLLPGQVLLFRMRSKAIAKHLGILSQGDPTPTFVHAYSGREVHESSLSMPWVKRVVARFEFPTDGDR